MFDHDLFIKAIEDVARINKIDPASPEHRLCKVYEEAGELTRAINKTFDRKYTTDTKEQVLSEILEELADTLQCVYSWWLQCNPEDIKNTEEFLNKIKISLKPNKTVEQSVFCLYNTIPSYGYVNLRAEGAAAVVEKILNIGQCFNYTFNDINEKVLEKNKKWILVTKKKEQQKKLLVNKIVDAENSQVDSHRETPRYFLDIRSGCAAVRDKWHESYDADYPGLHGDTADVVEYRHGYLADDAWNMKEEDVKYLIDLCERLNKT